MHGKLYRLEAIRGLAALYVVFHHTLPHSIPIMGFNFGYALRFGQEAVMLFFLLSGFVINYSFTTSENKTFLSYFSKRFTRIYIPLVIIFVVGYLAESYNAGDLVNPQFMVLLGNLLMLQDWGFAKPNVIVEAYLSNGVLWSLSYEWWFYMAYFPLKRHFERDDLRDSIVFFAAIIGACLYLYSPTFLPRLIMYIGIWWAGVSLSDRYMKGELDQIKCLIKPIGSLFLIVGVLSLGVVIASKQGHSLTLGRHPVLELRHFLMAVLFVLAALVWRRAKWRWFDLSIKPFSIFAPISYVIYISHHHLFESATYLTFIGNPIIEWFSYFTIMLLFSYIVEKKIYPPVRTFIMSKTISSIKPKQDI